MSILVKLKSHRDAMRAAGQTPKAAVPGWAIGLGIASVFAAVVAGLVWLNIRNYNKSRPTAVQPPLKPFFDFMDERRIWKRDVSFYLEENYGSGSSLINVLEFENELSMRDGNWINLVTYPIAAKSIDFSAYSNGTEPVKDTKDLFLRIVSTTNTKVPNTKVLTDIGAALRRMVAILALKPEEQVNVAPSFLSSAMKVTHLIRYNQEDDWYYIDQSTIATQSVTLTTVLSTDHRLSFTNGPMHATVSGLGADYVSTGTVFMIAKEAAQRLVDGNVPNVRSVVNLYSVIASMVNMYERLAHDASTKYMCAWSILARMVYDQKHVFFPDIKIIKEENGSERITGPSSQLEALHRVEDLLEYLRGVTNIDYIKERGVMQRMSTFDDGASYDESVDWQRALFAARYIKDGAMEPIAAK